ICFFSHKLHYPPLLNPLSLSPYLFHTTSLSLSLFPPLSHLSPCLCLPPPFLPSDFLNLSLSLSLAPWQSLLLSLAPPLSFLSLYFFSPLLHCLQKRSCHHSPVML